MTERRQTDRVYATDEFLIEFRMPGKKYLEKGYGCDLSGAGARFAAFHSPREGSPIDLTFHLSPAFPGPKKLTLKSKVVRVQRRHRRLYARIACKFEEKGSAPHSVLQEFLQWISSCVGARSPRPATGGETPPLHKRGSVVAVGEGRRKARRVQATDQFLIEFRHGKRRLYDKGFGCDLSSTGARFTTLVPFRVGSLLDMLVHFSPMFPGARKAEFLGEVVQSQHAKGKWRRRIGCKFHGGEPESRETLRQFLSWVESRNA